jgi:SSS family solute:Na+ symporter
MDLYHRFRRNASQHQLVWVGRVATVVMTLIGLVWIPVIRYAPKGLYDYLQSVQGYLAPPIFVVFFLGVFWKRLNAAGCLAALIVGFAMGVFRLAVDTPVKLKLFGVDQSGNAVEYAEGSFLWIVNHIYFQYFGLLIFLVSVLAMVIVSYLTAEPSATQIQGLTYATRTEEQRRQTRESWSSLDVFTSIVVMAAIIAAYLYFRG